MLDRVVICFDQWWLNRTEWQTAQIRSVFGPFEGSDQATEFLADHEKVCDFGHCQRKLNPAKFGVSNASAFALAEQNDLEIAGE